MANKYGYMAKIGIDSSGLQKGLKDVDSAISSFSREMKAVNSVIANGGDSAEMAAQKNELYANEIAQLNNKLKALRSAEEDVNKARENRKISEKEYREYRREIESTEASIRNLTEEQKNFNGTADDGAEKVSRFGDVLKANIATEALKALADVLKQAAGAIKDYALEGIELASDLTEKQNVVDVTFGSGSSKIYEFADTAAEKFGLTKLAAEGYAGTMGALFKSSGITKDIEDMSIKMSQLAGDMASFYNISSDTAFEKLRAGISGESEPLKQLGINLSVANLEAYALSEGITTAWKDMSQAEQTMHRYNYILSQTADAQGDFERTSDSFANQQRIMQLNLQSLQAEIGEKLLPVAQEMLGLVNDHMPEIEEAANYFADEMIPVISDLADEAKTFVENGGLEDIVDVLKWVMEHGDTIIAVMAGMWGTEKAVQFGGTMLELPGKIDGVLNSISKLPDSFSEAKEVMSGLGETAEKTASKLTTAITGAEAPVTASLGAVAAAAVAAAAAIASAIAVADELNTIADGMTSRTAETQKSDDNIIALQDRWKEISELRGIDKYNEANSMLDDIIADEEEWNTRYKETIDELNTLQEKKFKTADQTARMKELQTQKASLDAEYETLQLYHTKLKNEIGKYDDQTIANLERSAEAQAQAQANAGKTNEQAVSEAWGKIRETTKNEMDKYDDELATHQIDDTEYWRKRKAYLEAHRDEESKEWWGYYDEVTEYYENLSETEKAAAEKAASEAEKTAKENYQKRVEALENMQAEKGYSDEWYLGELKKIIDSLDKSSELYASEYSKYAQKQRELIDKNTKEEADAWKKSAEEISEAVKSKYEDVQKEFEKSKDGYINALDLTEEITEAGTGEKRLIFNDVSEQTDKLHQYRENMAKLEQTGISDEYLNQIKSMSYEDRSQYVEELLKLSPKNLQKHYSDIEKYYEEARLAGLDDTDDMKAEADEMAAQAEKTIETSLNSLSPQAYESGKSAAEEYIRGFNETMSLTDILLGTETTTASSKSSKSDSYSDISTDTPVTLSLNIDGKQFASVVNITINDFFNAIRNGGGTLNV